MRLSESAEVLSTLGGVAGDSREGETPATRHLLEKREGLVNPHSGECSTSPRRRRYGFAPALLVAFVALAAAFAGLVPVAGAESRIKDITRVEGVRDNDLIGYGLVVGLKGTGDSGGAMFTVQSVANMLMRFGIKITPDQMRVKNVAAVMVTAKLPAFARVGDRLDVVVSSLGDARSLEGGTLLLTPLLGPDEKMYAAAQGVISLGGGAAGGARQKVHPTVASIPQGATVERELVAAIAGAASGTITLALSEPDFVTADRVAKAICARLGEGVAKAADAGAVEVQVPPEYADNLVGLVALIGEIPVKADAPARVVFNERTGTVVIGGNVRVLPAVVSHGNLRVQISARAESPTPVAPGGGDGQATAQAQVGAAGSNPAAGGPALPGGGQVAATAGTGTGTGTTGTGTGTVFDVSSVDTVDALVAALNAVGATPRDIIAILQALKACGALLAEIEVL
ncbi:MAG: flagellar basal body P-ring protein FlgI [Firmicutes bacterium]|nr:flagellar basal body P-ring protein FlgI [Bacillota bacterium]